MVDNQQDTNYLIYIYFPTRTLLFTSSQFLIIEMLKERINKKNNNNFFISQR